MAQITRASHKDRFQTGDIPTEGQYADLIDSNLNLSENNILELHKNIKKSDNINLRY